MDDPDPADPVTGLTLEWVAGVFACVRLGPTDPIPDWAWLGPFSSVTRTAQELSILCNASHVPAGVRSESGLIAFRVAGPLAFDAIGILRSLCVPLAGAGIAIIAVGTFDTDYVFVAAVTRRRVEEELTRAGHRFGC